jgi:prepilin-type N-terminal cleavage/methylation domain-containing protein
MKKNKNYKKNKAGFSLIEVLIACSIISLTTIALTSAASKGVELSNRALRQVQANMLVEEGVEAVKSIRDTNWATISSLSLNTNYYLTFNINTNTWSLDTTSITPVDGIFTRVVVISEVNRDSNDDIASSGTVDVGIKRVNVAVSWPLKDNTVSKNITFYLTNIFN